MVIEVFFRDNVFFFLSWGGAFMMRLRGRLDEERRGLSGGPTRAALASPPHAALSEPLCRCK